MPNKDWRFASEPNDDERDEDALGYPEPEDVESEDEGVDYGDVISTGIKLADATRATFVAIRDHDPDASRLLKIAERLQTRMKRLNAQMEAADG